MGPLAVALHDRVAVVFSNTVIDIGSSVIFATTVKMICSIEHNTIAHSPVESVIVTVTLFLPPALIPLVTDEGILKMILNVSFPSTISSTLTGTLTLLLLFPLSNVAVSGVVLKSTPPVSQTLFSQHIIIHTLHYYLQQTLVTVLME